MPLLLPLLLLTCALLGLLHAGAAAVSPSLPPSSPPHAPRVILVVGAPGEDEFGSNFVSQVHLWQKVASQGGADISTIGLDPAPDSTTDSRTATTTTTPAAISPTNDLARLQSLLAAEPATGTRDLWIILIGHGTFDGKEARFNLRGPDLAAADLATALKSLRRPIAILNTASASAPFLKPLAGPDRIVVTATRSGFEHNFTRFGRFLAESIADPHGDLDQDGQTSLLEAFLSASFRVAEFYKTEGRMLTEHALIDDNGDGLGTPADWFRGLRAVKKSKDGAALDGIRAHQFHLVRSPDEARLTPEVRARRDALEREIAALRESRPAQPDDAWYAKLEPLLLELARLYPSQPSR